jgi:hypothetical protein
MKKDLVFYIWKFAYMHNIEFKVTATVVMGH